MLEQPHPSVEEVATSKKLSKSSPKKEKK